MPRGFQERWPDIVVPQPGGQDDPLGESVIDPAQPAVRVFEPTDCRIIIGRSQNPQQECVVDACAADGVPIHRRLTGGGAVVLAPGMIVVAVRMPRMAEMDSDCYFARINDIIVPVVAAHAGQAPVCRGHGDLAMALPPQPGDASDQAERKILGTSLRQYRDWAAYLGVLMVADARPLMQRYLSSPSRQPDYRGDRDHDDFCTYLAAFGVQLRPLMHDLRLACTTELSD